MKHVEEKGKTHSTCTVWPQGQKHSALNVPLLGKSLLELLKSAPARYAPDEDCEVGIRRGAGPVLVPLPLVALSPVTS